MATQPSERLDTVSDELADFIISGLNWDGAKEDLLSRDPIDLAAILASSDLLELAGWVEEKYGIEISDEEVVAETFSSVNQLAQVVVAKQTALGVG